MATRYIVQKRLFHAGSWREPGQTVDAEHWPSLRAMLGGDFLRAEEVEGESPPSQPVESQTEEPEEQSTDEDRHAELMRELKADLIDMAVEQGKDPSGTKEEIVARLV